MLEIMQATERRIMYRNIEKLMKQRGITAYRLAKDIGINQSTISKWKKGQKIGFGSLYKIASYFKVPVESLLV